MDAWDGFTLLQFHALLPFLAQKALQKKKKSVCPIDWVIIVLSFYLFDGVLYFPSHARCVRVLITGQYKDEGMVNNKLQAVILNVNPLTFLIGKSLFDLLI